MTGHYTHVGELAAANAVALLPAVTGDVITVAPSKSAPNKIPRAMSAILKNMTAANWKTKRSELLALLSNKMH